MTYICKGCQKISTNSTCCGVCVPYTGGQGYKRSDGTYSWRFYIAGDQRAKGTNRLDSLTLAVTDFIEIFDYEAQ